MNIKLSSVICVMAWCNVFGLCWYGTVTESFTTAWYVMALLFANVALFSGVYSWEKPTQPHATPNQRRRPANGAYPDATDPIDN